MRTLGTGLGGLRDALRSGHGRARLLAVADGRAVVRALFLSSAIRSGLLEHVGQGADLEELAAGAGCRDPGRLRAWLDVGCELGEIGLEGARYVVRGARARAICGGDSILRAQYRSVLDYQTGPYAEIDELLRTGPTRGRSDLTRFADDIAQVSLAAAPFVSAFVRRVVRTERPSTVLDVGCGSGVYARVVLECDPAVTVTGIDLSEEVVAGARSSLRRAGLESRATLLVGDVRRWVAEPAPPVDLIMVHNSIYYVAPEERVEFYRSLGDRLSDDGALILSTMTTPGSIASAHLNFMLACQAGGAILPTRSTLTGDLGEAGFSVIEEQRLVPTEPYVGLRAVPGRGAAAYGEKGPRPI